MNDRARAWILLGATFALAACFSEPPHTRGSETAPPLVIPRLSAEAGPPSSVSGAQATQAFEPSPALTIAARDPRMAKRRPQSRAHTLAQVQALERLLDAAKKEAPDRPDLHRRIAEGWSELASTASGPDAVQARKAAIKHYAAIVADHPAYGQIDEVHYYLGLAHELNGDLKSARASFFALVQRSPASTFVPLAYFAFGEMFLAEAETDPAKYDLAEQSYREALKYPAATNPILPHALLRTGEIHQRRGDPQRAKEIWDRLAREFPDSPAAAHIPTRP